LEVHSQQSDAPDLTFLSSDGNIVPSEVDGLKMACNCRFVKDPSSPSFLEIANN